MGKLTIQDIAKVLCDRKGLTKKEADNFVNEMFDIIQQALERDMIVKVKGLGTFKIIDVDPRESVNVNTGERVLIDGHSKITFTSDQLLKEIVNKPFSQFETVVLNDGVDFSEEAASGAYVNPEMAEELKASAEAATQTEAPADSASMPLVDFVNHDPSFEKPVTLGEPQTAEMPAPVEEPVVEEKVSEPVSLSQSVPPHLRRQKCLSQRRLKRLRTRNLRRNQMKKTSMKKKALAVGSGRRQQWPCCWDLVPVICWVTISR